MSGGIAQSPPLAVCQCRPVCVGFVLGDVGRERGWLTKFVVMGVRRAASSVSFPKEKHVVNKKTISSH